MFSEWFGWDNMNSGADVIVPGFYNSSQSILISEDDDLVHEFSGINSGSGELILYMMIPSSDNSGAYFNVLHDYDGANSNWAYEVYFASNQSGEPSYLAADTNVEFDAIYDQWIEIRQEIDIDNDNISFYYNDVFIHSWAWSEGSTPGSSVLGAIDLYGACIGSGCESRAWYDNIELCGFETTNSEITENPLINYSLYPNPNNGVFELSFNANLNTFNIEIQDLIGKVIYSETVDNYKINSQHVISLNQASGTYIISIKMNGYSDERLIIIK